MERKTGGWLSSVVGNISGLWSRSPTESAATFRSGNDTHNSSHNSSYEEQAESDVGEEDDGIIIESVCAGSSSTIPTTSSSRSDITPKRNTVRYLSPSALLAATRSVTTSFDKEALTDVSRKRGATSCIFQDDIISSNSGNAFVPSRTLESPSGRFPTKRLRIQRDFPDERSFFSSTSLSDAPSTGKSCSNQSFASSFTTLNSLAIKPRVSRPSSAVSSLSSKTRAILEQLEKISTPVKEVKRLSSLNLDGPERWANDTISSAVQKPPRNSMCSLSRAQLISNILSTKSSSPFWSRPAYPAKVVDTSHIQAPECIQADVGHEHDSVKISTTKSSILPSKRADSLSSSRKPDWEKVSIGDGVDKSTVSPKTLVMSMSTSISETGDNGLPQHPTPAKSTNVFNARDMGVVSPVKEMVKSDDDKLLCPAKADGTMFTFAAPVKRGPSSNSHRKETTEKISQHVSFAETESKTTTEKPVGGSFPVEGDSKQIEEQPRTADKDKETQSVIEVPVIAKSTDAGITTSDALSVKQPSQKSAEQWSCPKCLVFNKADVGKCICCGCENHLLEAKPWTCSECWVSNKSVDDKCVACGNPKQSNGKSVKLTNITAHSNSLVNVFGDRTFKPMSSSGGISFGFTSSKLATDGASVTSLTSAQPTSKAVNAGTIVNGNANTERPLKFGLSSSTSTPVGFAKVPVTDSFATVTEEQPLAPSSHPPNTSISFGAPSSSSVTTTSVSPSLTRASLSFPTLTITSAVTTLTASESIFSIPVSTNVTPFTFGSSSTTTVEETRSAPLFAFGSAFPAGTTSTVAATSTASLPSFGTVLPEFSAPKAPLFGASGGTELNPGGNHDVVDMSSPTTSPVAPATIGSFGMSKSSTPSLFNFGASNSSISSTGTLFGNLQTTVQNPSAAPSTSLFSFGQQQMPVASKPFEPAASLTSPAPTFNFGATASNGATGFVFGSTPSSTNFTFGGQQPVNNAASASFSFPSSTPAPSFGNVPGSAAAPNFFSVGSTSSTTARKMLKARRMRK